jgi:hypothetical protein
VLSMLASTDLVPRALRREFLEPYVVKALPCIAVWLKIVISSVPLNRERNSGQT